MARRRDARRDGGRVATVARDILSRVRGWTLPACLCVATAPLYAAGAGFTSLEAPGSQLLTLSRDGRAGAGSLVGGSTGGFRWSEEEGIALLPGALSVQGMSASGRYIAGSALDAEQREVASYWTAGSGPVRLGGLPDAGWQGGVVSIAFGISDEPRAVGVASDPQQRAIAFEWTADRGMRALPLPPGTKRARAGGISDDGRHVYGCIEPATGPRRGVLWHDGAPQLLSHAGDAQTGDLLGGNRDLSVLVGVDSSVAGGGGDIVYRWRAGTISQRLKLADPLAPPLQLFASSDDGRVLVGSTGSGAARVAVAWTPQTGLLSLDRLLAARGVAVPAGWTLSAASGISGDGRRIGGWGLHFGRFDSFVVDLPDASAPANPP